VEAEEVGLGPEAAGQTAAHGAALPSTAASQSLASQAALLDLVPDAFVGIDADGGITLANKQVESLFGYSHEQLIGQPLEILLPERFVAAHRGHRARFFSHPHTRPMDSGLELTGRRLDGSEFPAEISLGTIELEGHMLATAAIRDISDRIAVVREKERLEAEAEREHLVNQLHHVRRLESLGELAGGVAHDFNNLLAVIINYAAFVAEDLDAAGESEEKRHILRADVEQIGLAAQRAAHLTHQLLAFARREVVQPEVVDVNTVVADIEQLLTRTLGEHITLRSELAADLRSVLIDPGQLEQMLVNLAINARDAMPNGGTLTIDTANFDIDADYTHHRPELSPGPYVRLRVSDNGTGMEHDVIERAFDPFFTTKPAGQGTGLGLATVYGIVQQAGGQARIYSESSIGTTFTALLPATDRSPTRAPVEIDRERLRGKSTILLVEDEQALREVIERILTSSGYQVLSATNGAEALALAGKSLEGIDLLLTDVIMPVMHGPQLAEQIKQMRPSIRVMFMSGFAQPILDAGGHLEPGVILIEKPFAGADLLEKVRQVLESDAQSNSRQAGGEER